MVDNGQLSIREYSKVKRSLGEYLQTTKRTEPNSDLINLWYWGDSGSGKSLRAREGQDYYSKMPSKWWDGYNGQSTVIVDDLDPSHEYIGYHLKIWADHYSFNAEIKGGAINIRPKSIIVTSNYHPKDIFKD